MKLLLSAQLCRDHAAHKEPNDRHPFPCIHLSRILVAFSQCTTLPDILRYELASEGAGEYASLAPTHDGGESAHSVVQFQVVWRDVHKRNSVFDGAYPRLWVEAPLELFFMVLVWSPRCCRNPLLRTGLEDSGLQPCFDNDWRCAADLQVWVPGPGCMRLTE